MAALVGLSLAARVARATPGSQSGGLGAGPDEEWVPARSLNGLSLNIGDGLGRPDAVGCADTAGATGSAGPEVVPFPAAVDLGIELRINVPAYRLDVYELGTRTRSFRVAVGMPGYPTPTGLFEISRVTWNPWWIPPDREWARGEKTTPPGPRNPMGRVKLNAGRLLYLHGTPDTTSPGHAASHGCLRLSNADAIELARLVHRYASPGLGSEELHDLEENPSLTRTFTLAEPVPLTIVYDVAEVRDASLVLHPDIYGRLGTGGALSQAIDALGRAGFPPERLDRERLEELVRAARREAASAPIDALLAPTGRTRGQPPSMRQSAPAAFAGHSRGVSYVVRGGDGRGSASPPRPPRRGLPPGDPAHLSAGAGR